MSQAGDAVPVKELPSAVREAVAKKYPKAETVSAERGSERNDYVYYTIAVQDGEGQRTVTVTEFGEILPAKP
ncbi:MAG TPA: hypothetical protein VNB29_11680 [Chthoniobacterales bacterium]|nr:hypothetical protein [Chthoniobacterales bacterium]